MKAVRYITLMLVLAIAFSVWPSAVYAMPANPAAASSIVEKPKSGFVKLSVTNKTGGTIFIQLVGEGRSYSFSATAAGKNTFEILPGRYTYTLSTSACRGSVTKTRNFKGSSASLGSWVCRK